MTMLGPIIAVAIFCICWNYKVEQISVVGWKLPFPYRICRGGAAEGGVEAGEVVDLRQSQVEKHARHAALQFVAQTGPAAVGVAVRMFDSVKFDSEAPMIATTSVSVGQIILVRRKWCWSRWWWWLGRGC
ncbi:hypothetical protein Vadar_028760 [Vaccinium darrowii]|uniref:Uncharacterized protein n=1 Tax=Vaccinium darrowii TaxID=229202 RepID=A0ACB7YGR8_9ERIC|nr:hypothetical protein Vadar_028760 [Vaccinium darrowii]